MNIENSFYNSLLFNVVIPLTFKEDKHEAALLNVVLPITFKLDRLIFD